VGSGRSGCFGLALENSDQYYTDQWQSCGDDAKPRRRPHFEPEQAEIIKAKRNQPAVRSLHDYATKSNESGLS